MSQSKDLELIASGYGLVEAPRTDPSGNLWFTDAQRGTVHRADLDGRVTTVIENRSVGGLVFHANGGIILSGPNVAHWKEGAFQILLQRDGVSSFNDLHTDAAGCIYVGSIRATDLSNLRVAPTATGELYRIETDGHVTELYDNVGVSNGIGLSPDGRMLYHVDTTSRGLWVHKIGDTGELFDRTHIGAELFKKGLPDGMCVDAQGNLWVAHVAGYRVVKMDPQGTFLDQIEVPARAVTSCAFGGSDYGDLYIVSADNTDDPNLGGCIWRCRPGIAGHPTAVAQVRTTL